jgi:hypothetical protein
MCARLRRSRLFAAEHRVASCEGMHFSCHPSYRGRAWRATRLRGWLTQATAVSSRVASTVLATPVRRRVAIDVCTKPHASKGLCTEVRRETEEPSVMTPPRGRIFPLNTLPTRVGAVKGNTRPPLRSVVPARRGRNRRASRRCGSCPSLLATPFVAGAHGAKAMLRSCRQGVDDGSAGVLDAQRVVDAQGEPPRPVCEV